jgi:hypothetical protein
MGKTKGKGKDYSTGGFHVPFPAYQQTYIVYKKKPILCLGYLHPYQIDSPTKHYLREFSWSSMLPLVPFSVSVTMPHTASIALWSSSCLMINHTAAHLCCFPVQPCIVPSDWEPFKTTAAGLRGFCATQQDLFSSSWPSLSHLPFSSSIGTTDGPNI